MKKIFFTLLVSLIVEVSFAQSFYVDGVNGNDNNSGTSLGQAWQTLQFAFDNATPGSTVYIKGGTYFENVYPSVSGTAGNPITFRNYQNDTVILDGTGTLQTDMIYMEDESYLTIENITIQNKVAAYATGIVISATPTGGATGITLKNIKVINISWTSNPNATPTSNDNSNPILVYGSGANQANAIKNILIDSCDIYGNITGFSENISLDGNVDSFVVSHNIVHDNKNIGIDMAGNYATSSNPAMDQARNGHCFQNICFNNVSDYATSGGIYVDGGKDIIIERNTSYGNGWGIEIGCEQNGSASNIIVRDNVIYNNKEAGLAIGGYDINTTGQVLNSSVLNNTFLKDDSSNSGTGEIYMTKLSNCKIRNNIFYTNAQNILISRDNISPFSGNSINYNCWYTPNNDSANITVNWGTSSYSSFPNYVSQTGMDSLSTYADPLLTNSTTSSPDFHLQNSSPCIEGGDPAFIAGNNETDFYGGGRIINSKVDMGAHESSFLISVAENNNTDIISVYPNPSQGIFSMDGLGPLARIEIYNSVGEKMYGSPVSNKQEIKVNIPGGIYFCKVFSGKNYLGTSKLVIR